MNSIPVATWQYCSCMLLSHSLVDSLVGFGANTHGLCCTPLQFGVVLLLLSFVTNYLNISLLIALCKFYHQYFISEFGYQMFTSAHWCSFSPQPFVSRCHSETLFTSTFVSRCHSETLSTSTFFSRSHSETPVNYSTTACMVLQGWYILHIGDFMLRDMVTDVLRFAGLTHNIWMTIEILMATFWMNYADLWPVEDWLSWSIWNELAMCVDTCIRSRIIFSFPSLWQTNFSLKKE